jgi:hypothetical protein
MLMFMNPEKLEEMRRACSEHMQDQVLASKTQ